MFYNNKINLRITNYELRITKHPIQTSAISVEISYRSKGPHLRSPSPQFYKARNQKPAKNYLNQQDHSDKLLAAEILKRPEEEINQIKESQLLTAMTVNCEDESDYAAIIEQSSQGFSPERIKKVRDALRMHLKNLGFYELQKSVFICPFPCTEEINQIVDFYNIHEHIRVIVAHSIDNEEELMKQFNVS